MTWIVFCTLLRAIVGCLTNLSDMYETAVNIKLKNTKSLGIQRFCKTSKHHEQHLIEFARQSASRQEDDKAAVALELQRAGYQTMKPGPGGLWSEWQTWYLSTIIMQPDILYRKSFVAQILKVTKAMNWQSVFIGPRCPWGPIYGSWCQSVTHYKTICRLNWCYAGWCWYISLLGVYQFLAHHTPQTVSRVTQTTPRHLPASSQTTPRHLPDTSQTPSRHTTDTPNTAIFLPIQGN